jgi:hypothetical protein
VEDQRRRSAATTSATPNATTPTTGDAECDYADDWDAGDVD